MTKIVGIDGDGHIGYVQPISAYCVSINLAITSASPFLCPSKEAFVAQFSPIHGGWIILLIGERCLLPSMLVSAQIT